MNSYECDTYEKLLAHSVEKYQEAVRWWEEKDTVQDDDNVCKYFRRMVFNTIRHHMNRHLRHLIAEAHRLPKNSKYGTLSDCLYYSVMKQVKANQLT